MRNMKTKVLDTMIAIGVSLMLIAGVSSTYAHYISNIYGVEMTVIAMRQK